MADGTLYTIYDTVASHAIPPGIFVSGSNNLAAPTALRFAIPIGIIAPGQAVNFSLFGYSCSWDYVAAGSSVVGAMVWNPYDTIDFDGHGFSSAPPPIKPWFVDEFYPKGIFDPFGNLIGVNNGPFPVTQYRSYVDVSKLFYDAQGKDLVFMAGVNSAIPAPYTGPLAVLYNAFIQFSVSGAAPVQADTAGIDVLYWREGYTITEIKRTTQEDGTLAPTGLLQAQSKWHYDMEFTDDPVTIDEVRECERPRLAHSRYGPPLSVVYVRKDGIYRQESNDYGQTWKPDPDDDKPFHAGDNTLAGTEVWNERTGERLLFYGDGSGISVDVYGPDKDTNTGRLVKHATYPVADKSDNASFGATWVDSAGFLECAFQTGGKRNIYRSLDDGRSWNDVT